MHSYHFLSPLSTATINWRVVSSEINPIILSNFLRKTESKLYDVSFLNVNIFQLLSSSGDNDRMRLEDETLMDTFQHFLTSQTSNQFLDTHSHPRAHTLLRTLEV